jgi:CDP-6-deoxy-D-xylo-4-hexulose-3-dehydrase
MTLKEKICELSHQRLAYVPDYSNFVAGVTPVLYSGPFWDNSEIEMAMEALLTGKWLTSGEYVARFQNEFARRFNVRHAYMVNSGSSANLVLMAAVKKRLSWNDGDEIIVSPVGFPTTVAPIVQNGLKPVFIDIEMNTLNFDVNIAHHAIFSRLECEITSRTRAIFVSPVLGNPPDMDAIMRLCQSHDIILLGDNCDSLGSRWGGRFLNELYYAWTTSFYPAHHITTGEGGMVCSNDRELDALVRSFAQWGRACYCVGAANTLPCGTCGKRFSNWLGGDAIVDHKYIFDNMGYNLKPLDLQGAIGLAQLNKLDFIERSRRDNARRISEMFEEIPGVRVAVVHQKADPCWFGVPVICDSSVIRESMVAHLEANKIQTRPYFAGNLLRHGGFSGLANAASFPNADRALGTVFFLGCPPHYTTRVRDHIKEVICRWQPPKN